jgi:hypothetical protein
MLRRFAVCFATLALISSGMLLAHGGKVHVLGTVTAVDANHVEVKTQNGKVTSIRLKVGDRVVVDVTGEGAKLTATDVRIGTAGDVQAHDAKTRQPKKP